MPPSPPSFFRAAVICLAFVSLEVVAQTSGIFYQDPSPSGLFGVGVGTYGRVGVNWNYVNERQVGRRLNLNNMGSIGGRMEEQDYLEVGVLWKSKPLSADSTEIRIQLRANVFSRSISFFGSNSTSSLGGLAIGLPEMFVESRNTFTEGLTFWVGNRLYRGPDVHMADYFYFNNLSGQGFGIEYKNTLLHANFVSSTDTTQTVPPYFYLNVKTGTPSLELRERVVLTLEHNLFLFDEHVLTLHGEYHSMPGPEEFVDSLNFPGDTGWVLGARLKSPLKQFSEGSFNHISARYGSGIANGGDGGSSQTHATYGAPNLVTESFESARGVELVDHLLINFSRHFSLNGYMIYHFNRGAADTPGESPTYFGRTVFNQKKDFTIGFKGVNYLSDKFHLQTEVHYSQRQDGEQPWYRMTKFSIIPTLAPSGQRTVWARPHLRFVASVAKYNDYARDNLYSPYLQLVGAESWGYYLGVKAEWWTF